MHAVLHCGSTEQDQCVPEETTVLDARASQLHSLPNISYIQVLSHSYHSTQQHSTRSWHTPMDTIFYTRQCSRHMLPAAGTPLSYLHILH